jgi:hypothetical protein
MNNQVANYTFNNSFEVLFTRILSNLVALSTKGKATLRCLLMQLAFKYLEIKPPAKTHGAHGKKAFALKDQQRKDHDL